MKLTDLARELQITTESIKRFIQDFDLELSDCLYPNLEVKPDFEKFALENTAFLQNYEKDLNHKKSVEDIAEKIHQPKEKIEEFMGSDYSDVYDNGFFRSSVSSFGIDNKLGGNYNFVYDYFGKKTPLWKKDFIGYRDLFFYISDVMEPFINPESVRNWGIQRPAGIILYGPPGSGKIFWANKISEIIGYQFREVKKYYFGVSYINGEKTSFNDFLISMLKQDKVELFVEDFNQIMQEGNPDYSREDEETKEIILHYISKFESEDILMVGSANTVSDMDEEVLAPGRFDVLVPVFPPNVKERAQLIQYSMLRNLDKEATLYKILEKNGADHLPFWNPVAVKMKTFSNTMVIDFTQSLKKRIRTVYMRTRNEDLKIDEQLLDAALRDAAGKLTEEYLNQIQQFLHDVSLNNYDAFARRFQELKAELDSFKVVEEPCREIGFHQNGEKKQ